MAAESSCKGHGHGEDKESQPLLQSSQDDGHSRGSPLISGQHPVGQLWREAEASLCRPRRSPSLPPSLPHELCPQPLGSALGLSRASSDKTIRGRNIYGKVVKMQISAVAPRVRAEGHLQLPPCLHTPEPTTHPAFIQSVCQALISSVQCLKFTSFIT